MILNKGGFTALHMAAQNGHNQSARILLYARSFSVDHKNNVIYVFFCFLVLIYFFLSTEIRLFTRLQDMVMQELQEFLLEQDVMSMNKIRFA